MVITSALHAEGPGFEPQWNQRRSLLLFPVPHTQHYRYLDCNEYRFVLFFFFFPVEMGNRLSPSKRSKPCVGWRSEKQGAERPLTQDSLSPQGFTCSPLSTRGAERQPYTCRRPCAIARFCKSPNTSRQCHRRTSFFPLKKKTKYVEKGSEVWLLLAAAPWGTEAPCSRLPGRAGAVGFTPAG